MDVDRGEVEFILPDGHYREITCSWDGDNWTFKYAGLLQTGTNEFCKTPKEAFAK